jgi:hypothetical protein
MKRSPWVAGGIVLAGLVLALLVGGFMVWPWWSWGEMRAVLREARCAEVNLWYHGENGDGRTFSISGERYEALVGWLEQATVDFQPMKWKVAGDLRVDGEAGGVTIMLSESPYFRANMYDLDRRELGHVYMIAPGDIVAFLLEGNSRDADRNRRGAAEPTGEE